MPWPSCSQKQVRPGRHCHFCAELPHAETGTPSCRAIAATTFQSRRNGYAPQARCKSITTKDAPRRLACADISTLRPTQKRVRSLLYRGSPPCQYRYRTASQKQVRRQRPEAGPRAAETGTANRGGMRRSWVAVAVMPLAHAETGTRRYLGKQLRIRRV